MCNATICVYMSAVCNATICVYRGCVMRTWCISSSEFLLSISIVGDRGGGLCSHIGADLRVASYEPVISLWWLVIMNAF